MAKEPPVTLRTTVVVPIQEPPEEYSGIFKHFKTAIMTAINELLTFTAEDLAVTDFEMKNLRIAVQKARRCRKKRTATIEGHRYWQLRCVELAWTVDMTLTDFNVEMSSLDFHGKPFA
jgi:hypothetical protein